MLTPNRKHPSARAFTLIELLTVIAIIGILAAILIPVVGAVRETARISQNTSNLREVGNSLLVIADEDGAYPPSWDWGRGYSWASYVVEFLEGDAIIAGDRGTRDRARQHEILFSPVQFRGAPPTDADMTLTNYAANPWVMEDTADEGNQHKSRVSLGTLQDPSRTILVGDALPRDAEAPGDNSMGTMWWAREGINQAAPNDSVGIDAEFLEDEAIGPGGEPAFRNNGRAHFVFADGHVAGFRPEELLNGHFTDPGLSPDHAGW